MITKIIGNTEKKMAVDQKDLNAISKSVVNYIPNGFVLNNITDSPDYFYTYYTSTGYTVIKYCLADSENDKRYHMTDMDFTFRPEGWESNNATPVKGYATIFYSGTTLAPGTLNMNIFLVSKFDSTRLSNVKIYYKKEIDPEDGYYYLYLAIRTGGYSNFSINRLTLNDNSSGIPKSRLLKVSHVINNNFDPTGWTEYKYYYTTMTQKT